MRISDSGYVRWLTETCDQRRHRGTKVPRDQGFSLLVPPVRRLTCVQTAVQALIAQTSEDVARSALPTVRRRRCSGQIEFCGSVCSLDKWALRHETPR